MFEIIMLLAFLLSATSQLLADKPVNNRPTTRNTVHDKKKQRKLLQQIAIRADKLPGKAKRRNREYAYAA